MNFTVDQKLRKKITDVLQNTFDKTIINDIENSIYNFSLEYAEINDTPYLIDSIYENKSSEIIAEVFNKESSYVIDSIKNKTLDPKKIAFMKPEELNPDKYEKLLKKKEIIEYKKNDIKSSSAFKCSKCKKSRCEVSQKQVLAGDEPVTTFVKCLECGHSFSFH